MKKIILYFLLSIGFYTLISCASTQTQEDIICSTQFKMLNVGINGQQLDGFYTLRISDQDTIKIEDPSAEDSFYPILNDNYHTNLVNKRDSFHFIGLINDSIVVESPFVIGGDECHIYLHSGSQTINL